MLTRRGCSPFVLLRRTLLLLIKSRGSQCTLNGKQLTKND
jgi:hypothetical protein